MPDSPTSRFTGDFTRPVDSAELPERVLWEPPSDPPPRPAGAPSTFGPMSSLSGYRSNQSPRTPDAERGWPLRQVWAYLDGRWQDAFVHAEGRDQQGWWWCWVSLDNGFAWVLQVRTAERSPSPDDREWARRVWRR